MENGKTAFPRVLLEKSQQLSDVSGQFSDMQFRSRFDLHMVKHQLTTQCASQSQTGSKNQWRIPGVPLRLVGCIQPCGSQFAHAWLRAQLLMLCPLVFIWHMGMFSSSVSYTVQAVIAILQENCLILKYLLCKNLAAAAGSVLLQGKRYLFECVDCLGWFTPGRLCLVIPTPPKYYGLSVCILCSFSVLLFAPH